ncbi:uncharacterized protein TRAVEDRAFT_60462 [Trametes versicolor FP-101664 SS1]|uniref:uncharacterized protein n=1 Tax=Trametes versicolor (strain FP-101664) TaxID=717944 RepID=UPI0004624690|nr:uncharacterized protein TRAVEDRAFT_60462 [Trametes versicolor FP-101664 SS1]EIW55339.1 hypothetical protein TRAVEDRAFT_60462 [Trametes versicolor FP-101664 SS1]
MGISWSRLMRMWWGDTPAQDGYTESSLPSTTKEAVSDQQDVKEQEPPSVPCTMELRLMTETDSPSRAPNAYTISIDGKHWTLSEPLDINSETLPQYVCVSYVWGSGRVPNPVHPSIEMSDRTLAAFAATARCIPRRPIWIDAFCVPTERAKKRATLESLGFLFARADAVVSVLAPESLTAVEEMRDFLVITPRPAKTPSAPLDVLEADEWIRSVWTYQELVNSRSLWFTAHTPEGAAPQQSVPGMQVLNTVGEYIDRWGRSDKLTLHNGIRLFYPHADNFQELLADWVTSDYGHRSALRIICGMDYRAHITPQNRFYSMIGALTARPSARATSPTVTQLAERFMELSEEKGDYSFMFCTAPRDSRPGLGWRPIPSDFQSILTWHCFGDELPGKKVDDGVLLNDVIVFPLVARRDPAEVQMEQELLDHIRLWMKHVADYHDVPEDVDASMTLQEKSYAVLKTMGFTGDGGWHTMEGCIFYPQTKLPEGAEGTICVSHGVRWVFGAPAIVAITTGDAVQYVVGVAVIHMDYRSPTTEFLLR